VHIGHPAPFAVLPGSLVHSPPHSVLERESVLGDGLLKDARTEVLVLCFDTTLPGPRFFTRWGAPGC
jgi:hypothetical protein